MDKYFRVFKFMFEVWGMASKNRTLLRPVVYNILFAVPVMIALAIAVGVTENAVVSNIILGSGVTALYFIDYFCAGLTTSLIYDQITTGNASLADARKRTGAAAGGIFAFAAISAALDLLSTYAQERDDVLGKIVTSIMYSIWTTATFVVMPAMVLEGQGFGTAFSRSKDLMKQDPTNVGTGVIGVSAMVYLLGIAVFGAAYFAYGALAGLSPIVGALAFFVLVNVYWAVSGFIKISYFTCFYVWAKECETKGASSPAFAPGPLQAALA